MDHTPVPDDVVRATLDLVQEPPEQFKVVRLKAPVKDALKRELGESLVLTSGADYEGIRLKDGELSLIINEELLDATGTTNTPSTPDDALRPAVSLVTEGDRNEALETKVLAALTRIARSLPLSGARRRKTRKGKGKRKTTRRRKGLRG